MKKFAIAAIAVWIYAALGAAAITLPAPARAQADRQAVKGSGLAIPRFVSIKAGRANMRTGPGDAYPVKWQYKRRGLPVKVIGEFDHWREVVDHDGETGWMHKRLLSSKPMAVIVVEGTRLHRKAASDSAVVAIAARGVLMEVEKCAPDWCRMKNPEARGWVMRNAIWGAVEK